MASTQSDRSETDEETTSEEADQPEERAEADEAEDTDDSEAEGSDSDEDSASEDAGDDDAGDDDASDESELAAGGAASSPSTAKTRKGDAARPNKKDGLTAGARLAAAKAAKAARKAAKRGKEKKEADPVAQVRDSQLAKKAQEAGSWAAQNRNVVIAALVVILLGIAGWAGWSSYSDGQAQAAGALLADAVEIAQAEIVAAEEPGEDAAGETAREEADSDAPPTFPTEEARAEAALEAYRRVLTEYPSSDAAIWARLGEAKALADLGRHGEAREAYEAAEGEGGSDPSVALRALEGIAFTFEAEEQWDQALQVYERLAAIDGQRYQPVAEYHRARMYIAKGERERATETLRELVEDLGQAEDDDERQDFAYVLAQAETRLRELDPSAAPPPRASESPLGGLGGPGGQMSNEQLQELIRQFQQKQQREQQGGGAE